VELTTDLLTGTAAIDQQHRELVEMANGILKPTPGGGKKRVIKALRFLLSYVEHHFSAEERVMDAAAYPHREAHKRGHRYFIGVVKQLRRELRSGMSVKAARLKLHFAMQDWFLQHIRHEDRRMALWIREHRATNEDHELESVWERLRQAEAEHGSLDDVRLVRPPGIGATK